MSDSASNDNLPTFAVTMLGGSGVGKTVFMACMYVALSARGDLSIEAHPDLDTHLRNVYRAIQTGNLPEGTVGIQAKYEFVLSIGEHQAARIDWIDYRGGAIESISSEEEDASILHERVTNSDAVLVMLDLSSDLLKEYTVGGTQANEHLGIGRIRTLINSKNTNHKIKSVIFVRTKSDLVLGDNGEPNLSKACEELVDQLNDNQHFRNVPFSAAIAVSSCKVLSVGAEETKTVVASDPLNTEWVLFLALRDLFHNLKLSAQQNMASQEHQLRINETERASLAMHSNVTTGDLARKLMGKPDRVEERATQLAEQAASIVFEINANKSRIDKLEKMLGTIQNKIPTDQVRVFIR